jgi:hypothetical protein
MTTIPEPQLIISQHAQQRMEEMGVSEAEIRSTLSFPIRKYYSSHHNSITVAGRRIAVCIARELESAQQFVKTVLWADRAAAAILDPDRASQLTSA